MVDLHHHLLPGIDDGSPDLSTSVAMARMAADDGITHVVCTPHASDHWSFSPAAVAEHLAELRAALETERIALTLGSGCDFHLSYDNIEEAFTHPTKYTINGSRYLLVELPDIILRAGLGETFHNLRVSGMTAILTHPERNPTLQKDLDRLASWLRDGLLIQVTASSVLGKMGKEAEKMAHRLLENRWVHFLATDAHNINTRPPQMRAACDLVAKKYGEAYANALCTINPQAVFAGQPLPPLEPARNLFEEEDDEDPRPPLWKRILRIS
jgi:protein-tyrosine phosphatase